MNYNIKIKQNNGYLESDKSFYIVDNDKLTISVDKQENLYDVVVDCVNGDIRTKERIDFTKPYTIPNKVIIGGELKITLNVIAKGIVARQIVVQPILICETGDGLATFSEFDIINEQIQQLVERVAELNRVIERQNSRITDLEIALEQ